MDLIQEILSKPEAPSIISRAQSELENERLRRQKFYKDVTDDKKQEFINGEIVTHSPVKYEHSRVTELLLGLLIPHIRINDLGILGIEKKMISLTRNDYEPDICFFKKEKSSQFIKGQTHFPAPDFIVEILSNSTEKIDRGVKFKDYQNHGIEEYWIIDPENETIEQYLLKNGEYFLNMKSFNGELRSVAIENFKIEIKSIFDQKENIKQLTKILK